MHHHNHTPISAFVLHLSWLGLAAVPGCSEDTVPIYAVDCEDDASGWALDFPNLVELPPAEFPVECASGWGHGVDTQAASDIVELPNGCQWMIPHPEGGLLLSSYCGESLWSERLGVEVADDSLAWLDDQAEELRWIRDDLNYLWPVVVSTEAGTELWVWGNEDEGQDYLSRIEPITGELLERVVWPEGTEFPWTTVAAWPQEGGLWQLTRDSYDENAELYVLQRMSTFATLGPVLRTYELRRGFSWFADLDPTPNGGLL